MSIYDMVKLAPLFKDFAGVVADLKRNWAAKKLQAAGRGIVVRKANPEACFVVLAHRVMQLAFASTAASQAASKAASKPAIKHANKQTSERAS